MTDSKSRVRNSLHDRLRNSSITIVMIILTCFFLWSSRDLSRVSAWVPQLILSVTLVFLLIQLAIEFIGTKRPVGDSERRNFTGVLEVFVWIAAMMILVWLAGVSVGSGLFCLLYMRFYAGERWEVAAGFAAGLGIGAQLFFGTLMQVSLYQGILIPLLMN